MSNFLPSPLFFCFWHIAAQWDAMRVCFSFKPDKAQLSLSFFRSLSPPCAFSFLQTDAHNSVLIYLNWLRAKFTCMRLVPRPPSTPNSPYLPPCHLPLVWGCLNVCTNFTFYCASSTPLSFLSSNGNQFANVAEIRCDPRRQREYAKQLELLNAENYATVLWTAFSSLSLSTSQGEVFPN